jgi:ribosomal protein S18 acetylase RimI-like enzyme
MEFHTRICKPGDETTLSLIAQATILETYAGIGNGADLVKYATSTLTGRDFAQMLDDPNRFRVWIAETSDGNCAVGYTVAVADEHAKPFSTFELQRLYVFYRFHTNGLGKRLMEEVLSFAKSMKSETIWLQVHEANQHAIEFYKRIGFIQTGTDLYQAGEGSYRVLTMRLSLAPQV